MFDYTGFDTWAVLTAAVVSFVIGGLWYGPVLGKTWMKAAGVSDADLQESHPALVFGGAFVLQLLAAWALALLIGTGGFRAGLHWGLLAGLGFAVTASGVDDLFERRSLAHFLVNGGYKVLAFAAMGMIIGAWP